MAQDQKEADFLSGDEDDSEFLICGFDTPSAVRWMTGPGRPLTLSALLGMIQMEVPRVVEITVAWQEHHQTSVVHMTKDTNHPHLDSLYHESSPPPQQPTPSPSPAPPQPVTRDQHASDAVAWPEALSADASELPPQFRHIKVVDENRQQLKSAPRSRASAKVQQLSPRSSSSDCVTLEQCLCLLCNQEASNLALKIECLDAVSLQHCVKLLDKYRNHMRLPSLSNVWMHTDVLDGGSRSTNISLPAFLDIVQSLPAVTLSLSWHKKFPTSASELKLALIKVLSHVALTQHDVVIHYPIQHVPACYYVINDLVMQDQYFPHVAFNLFNLHSKEQKRSKRKLDTGHLVTLSELRYVAAHTHECFTFCGVRSVRVPKSSHANFTAWVKDHYVPAWTGKLAPSTTTVSTLSARRRGSGLPRTASGPARVRSPSPFPQSPPPPIPTQAGRGRAAVPTSRRGPSRGRPILHHVDWDLWTTARMNPNSRRHANVVVREGNIGLPPKGGWWMSTRELRPPYSIRGRFFAQKPHREATLSIFLRCAGLRFPPSGDVPAFGVQCAIGNQKIRLNTHRFEPKLAVQEDIGTTVDLGYNFQIVDRGVMYPLYVAVERTAKDGLGDNWPKRLELCIPHPRQPSMWMNHVVFCNTSDHWVLMDRLIVSEKSYSLSLTPSGMVNAPQIRRMMHGRRKSKSKSKGESRVRRGSSRAKERPKERPRQSSRRAAGGRAAPSTSTSTTAGRGRGGRRRQTSKGQPRV